MQELETLLNSLVQRDWKPQNQQVDFCEYKFWKFRFLKKSGQIVCMRSLRELVSLESGLWNFVCENELYKEDDCWEWRFTFDGVRFFYYKSLPKFRLLESALIPEEELGQFLVDNIKVEWK